MSGSNHIGISEEVHARLGRYGYMFQTYSEAIERTLEETEAADE